MNPPWPSEIWPVMPVRMTRPKSAIAYTATYVNSAIVNVPTKCGSAITAAASAAYPRRAARPASDAPHHVAAEQPGGAEEQDEDQDA